MMIPDTHAQPFILPDQAIPTMQGQVQLSDVCFWQQLVQAQHVLSADATILSSPLNTTFTWPVGHQQNGPLPLETEPRADVTPPLDTDHTTPEVDDPLDVLLDALHDILAPPAAAPPLSPPEQGVAASEEFQQSAARTTLRHTPGGDAQPSPLYTIRILQEVNAAAAGATQPEGNADDTPAVPRDLNARREPDVAQQARPTPRTTFNLHERREDVGRLHPVAATARPTRGSGTTHERATQPEGNADGTPAVPRALNARREPDVAQQARPTPRTTFNLHERREDVGRLHPVAAAARPTRGPGITHERATQADGKPITTELAFAAAPLQINNLEVLPANAHRVSNAQDVSLPHTETPPTFPAHLLPQNRIFLQLQPPELGHVQLHLHLTDENLTASLWADSADVRSLLHAHFPALHQALQERGFTTHQITITLAPDASGGNPGDLLQHHASGQFFSPRRDAEHPDDARRESGLQRRRYHRAVREGLLNVVV